MSKVYVLFVKQFDKTENYVYLPTFEIHYEPKEGKVAELNPGDCVDTFKCSLSDDRASVVCNLYRVSNIDGVAKEEFTETFMMAREK